MTPTAWTFIFSRSIRETLALQVVGIRSIQKGSSRTVVLYQQEV